MGAETTPVLIVGAGPTGTVLALELAHHNVSSLLVDRSARPSPHPKLDYADGRSMELLRRLGLADAVRAEGIGPDHSMDVLWTRGFDEPPVLVWHHPSVNQIRQRYATVNDGTAPAEPYQRIEGSRLELTLREAARAHPLVELCEGWTLADLRSDVGSVTATLVDPAGTGRRIVTAAYLVGCDGAGSTVRRCLDIPLETLGPPRRYRSVFFTSGDPALRRHGRAFVTIGPAGLTLVSRDERSEWTASLPTPPDRPVAADPIAPVRELLGLDFAVDEVISVAQWDGSLSVATRYGAGPVFLVGDAAHQSYSQAGFGGNTGIADAVDLGWKLAATVNGWGGEHLLDSYEKERRPAGLFHREMCASLLDVCRRFHRLTRAGASREQLAGVLEQEVHRVDTTGAQFGTRYAPSPVIWAGDGPAPGWRWDRITATTWPGARVPAVRLAGGAQVLDLLGPDLTLVDLSRDRVGAPLVRFARHRGVPMTHRPVDDAAVRACWERELVLVRPDHHVAWRGDGAPDNWDAVLDRVTGAKGP